MKTVFLNSIVLSSLLLVGCGQENETFGCGATNTTPTNETIETDEVSTVVEELQANSNAAIAASLEGVTEENKIPFGDGSFSPFERIAVLETVKGADGAIDHNATYAKTQTLAKAFANYVATTNEPATDAETFKGVNWIVGGIETETPTDEQISGAILAIPTKDPINPNYAASAINTKKIQTVEVCNSGYASQALGVVNVGGEEGEKVAKGSYHATALPCEVAIYHDEKAIYIDMLNPETIFTLFFTEVFESEQMNNEAFRNAMMSLPTQVKSEITAMVHNSLDAGSETYTKSFIKMGPIYSSVSQAMGVPQIAVPYKHYQYQTTGNKELTSTDAKNITQTLINVMTIHGNSNAGFQETSLLNALPSMTQETPINPSWRSARHEPLKVPGGTWLVEACSPAYAKEALSTGQYHATALPCEIAVFVNPDDNKTLNVSLLNPEFMFKGLFADSMAGLDQANLDAFENIINNINGDLKMMVDYALEHNVTDINQSTGSEITPIVYQ